MKLKWLLRDSLFARMAWLGIAVLLVLHLVWSALVFYQRPRQQVDGYARGLLFAIQGADRMGPAIASRRGPNGAIDAQGKTPAGGQAGNRGQGVAPQAGNPPPVFGDGSHPPGPPPGEEGGPFNADGRGNHPPGPPPDEGMRGMIPPPGSMLSAGHPPGPPRELRRVPKAQAPKFTDTADEEPASHLRHELKAQLPQGTELHVSENGKQPELWVLMPKSEQWIVVPLDFPPMPPFIRETVGILIGAVLLALLVAWQMQRPIARVAHAARVIARGRRPALLAEEGPHELRDLAQAFNDMARRLAEAEDNQAIMLAGIAHDLKSPLTRLRLRADLIDSENSRDGFVRDIKSIDHIVQQFLAYARDEADTSPSVGVDEFLREQFPADECAGDCRTVSKMVRDAGDDADDGAPEDISLFECDLKAGPAFKLPRTLLDRVMSNLVDNALEHGEPPVRLATWREDDTGCIEVTDCGGGIPADQVALAVRPFVRLDTARGGEGHCGLGLALVMRLIEGLGGNVRIDQAPTGGLRVTMRVPGAAGGGKMAQAWAAASVNPTKKAA